MSESPEAPFRLIRRYMRTGLAVCALVFFGVGGWAYSTEISGAVIAAGQVIVESNVKKVQHPTGGAVGEIFVKEGMAVKAGDLLIRLDDSVARANLAIVSGMLAELQARRARILAERDDLDEIVFPPELADRAGDPEVTRLIAGERRLFELRRQTRLGQKSQLKQRAAQVSEDIEGLDIQIEAKKKEIALVNRELESVRTLWSKNLIPIARVTQVEREGVRTSGELGRLVSAVAQSKAKISETEIQILQIDQELRSDVARELREVEGRMAEVQERKVAAEEQVKRMDLRSPQDGVVHQLQVFAAGAVVSPTTPVMLIVPSGDALAIEARVAASDIDQVRLSQPATFRLTSLNQRTTPELVGEIYQISPDAEIDQRSGAAYYVTRITLPKGEIEKIGEGRLIPGMPAEVFIRTDARTVMSYLLKPLSDQVARAFRER